MGDLEHLFDPDAGVAEHLDARPGPERAVGFEGEFPPGPGPVGVGGVDDAGPSGPAECRVGGQGGAAQGDPVGGERRAGSGAGRGGEQGGGVVAAGASSVDELRQERGEFAGALVHPRSATFGHLGEPGHIAGVDRGRRGPRSPASRVFQRPVGQVGVEGADRHQDVVAVDTFLAEPVVAIADMLEALFPAVGHLVGQVQGIDAGVVEFQVPPEQQHQFRGEPADRVVVQTRGPVVEVVDEQVAHRPAGDVIAVDHFLDAELAPAACRVDRRLAVGAQNAFLAQEGVPVGVLPEVVAGLGAVGLDTIADADLVEQSAVVHQDAAQLDQRGTLVGAGDPQVGHAAGGHLGEPIRVADLFVTGIQVRRRRTVEPLVTGSDHVGQDQPAHSPVRLRANRAAGQLPVRPRQQIDPSPTSGVRP